MDFRSKNSVQGVKSKYFLNGCLVYGTQKKPIRNAETTHKKLKRSEIWFRTKCTKICGLAKKLVHFGQMLPNHHSVIYNFWCIVFVF